MSCRWLILGGDCEMEVGDGGECLSASKYSVKGGTLHLDSWRTLFVVHCRC